MAEYLFGQNERYLPKTFLPLASTTTRVRNRVSLLTLVEVFGGSVRVRCASPLPAVRVVVTGSL